MHCLQILGQDNIMLQLVLLVVLSFGFKHRLESLLYVQRPASDSDVHILKGSCGPKGPLGPSLVLLLRDVRHDDLIPVRDIPQKLDIRNEISSPHLGDLRGLKLGVESDLSQRPNVRLLLIPSPNVRIRSDFIVDSLRLQSLMNVLPLQNVLLLADDLKSNLPSFSLETKLKIVPLELSLLR